MTPQLLAKAELHVFIESRFEDSQDINSVIFMEPTITEHKRRVFAGLEFYGPLKGEGWSSENIIDHFWNRWSQFTQKYSHRLKDEIVNPTVGYEIVAWSEDEYQKTKNFYIFVGVEIKDGNTPLPLQLVKRVLPGGLFAEFTARGEQITKWEDRFYQDWLPKSEFQLANYDDYSFQIQAYEDNRFKGVTEEALKESEIDILVPIFFRD